MASRRLRSGAREVSSREQRALSRVKPLEPARRPAPKSKPATTASKTAPPPTPPVPEAKPRRAALAERAPPPPPNQTPMPPPGREFKLPANLIKLTPKYPPPKYPYGALALSERLLTDCAALSALNDD